MMIAIKTGTKYFSIIDLIVFMIGSKMLIFGILKVSKSILCRDYRLFYADLR